MIFSMFTTESPCLLSFLTGAPDQDRLIRRPCFSFIMILEVFAISLVNLLAIILNTNVALNCV